MPHLHDRLELFARDLGYRDDVDHYARQRAASQPNADQRASADGKTIGDPVVERGECRDGESNARDGHEISMQQTRASRDARRR